MTIIQSWSSYGMPPRLTMEEWPEGEAPAAGRDAGRGRVHDLNFRELPHTGRPRWNGWCRKALHAGQSSFATTLLRKCTDKRVATNSRMLPTEPVTRTRLIAISNPMGRPAYNGIWFAKKNVVFALFRVAANTGAPVLR